MKQLPLFTNLAGRNVVLLGEGAEADAKRRLIERAGGICVPDCPNDICRCARIAFVALEDDEQAETEAERLRGKGMQVNVVDRPHLCDFTTPAIVDRDPVLIAVSTGGASAGMAKAIRQRIEALLPQSLGKLADAMRNARSAIKARWSDSSGRRRAIDAAFVKDGALDPFSEHSESAVQEWLTSEESEVASGLHIVDITSHDPEELTLRTARLLGEADHIYHDSDIASEIVARARADAQRHAGTPPQALPSGLIVYLRLHPPAR